MKAKVWLFSHDCYLQPSNTWYFLSLLGITKFVKSNNDYEK